MIDENSNENTAPEENTENAHTNETTENQTEKEEKTTDNLGPLEHDIEVPEITTSLPDTSTNEIPKQINDMADEKKPATETAPEKEDKTPKATKKDKEPATQTAVVKKDYTALIAAAVALVLLVGIFIWQNYRKRKEDENTIDVNHNEFDGTEYQQR